MYQEKVLTCRDCGEEFVFTVSEQEFFASKGFTNEPGRCPTCRAAKRQKNTRRNGGQRQQRSPRKMYPVTCAACGARTQVPFEPTNDKPVYCKDCYSRKKRTY